MNNNSLAKRFTPASILRFTLPNMVMMVFMSLYTIIDGMFISRYVGELALSCTNIFYPVTSLQYGLGIMLGTGGSAVIALKMGQGLVQEAKEDFTSITLTSVILGTAFTLVCIPLLTPILLRLGASDAQMPYCIDYAQTLLWFSPMMFLQMVFQVFFVTAGKPRLGLWLTVAGGVANMVLDYLFMGPLGWGVSGAAVATGIGYSVPAVVGLIYFFAARHGSLHFVRLRLRPKVLLRACANGSSEMVTNAAISVTTFLFNIIFMRFWAENGIAAITILSYFQFVFSAIFMGFSMGVAPIVSFKYGADDRQQLSCLFRFSLTFTALCSAGVFLVSHLTIRSGMALFTDRGSPVYNIGLEGFGLYSLQFLFMGISILTSGLFTALGNGVVSGIISLSRTFLFLVSSLLILPALWGETGVWCAVPLAELLGLMVSAAFLLWGRKYYHYWEKRS